MSILDPSRGIWIPRTIWHRLCHKSYLVHTTAGAVYWHTCKHLCERQVNQPNPEPPKADMEISCKVKTHMHAPIQPNVHHAPAGVQPEPAANQCTNPSTQHQCTPTKPTQQVAKHLSATRVQYNPVLNKRFQCHPVCQLPRFLLVHLVIPLWQSADQAAPTVHHNA